MKAEPNQLIPQKPIEKAVAIDKPMDLEI